VEVEWFALDSGDVGGNIGAEEDMELRGDVLWVRGEMMIKRTLVSHYTNAFYVQKMIGRGFECPTAARMNLWTFH